jgi:hypothetical protein
VRVRPQEATLLDPRPELLPRHRDIDEVTDDADVGHAAVREDAQVS